MSLFDTAQIISVKHPIGSFANGSKRFRPANYQLLAWASQSGGSIDYYVNSVGDSVSSNGISIDDAERSGLEFGYMSDECLVIEPHTADGSDSILGLHFIGYV